MQFFLVGISIKYNNNARCKVSNMLVWNHQFAILMFISDYFVKHKYTFKYYLTRRFINPPFLKVNCTENRICMGLALVIRGKFEPPQNIIQLKEMS